MVTDDIPWFFFKYRSWNRIEKRYETWIQIYPFQHPYQKQMRIRTKWITGHGFKYIHFGAPRSPAVAFFFRPHRLYSAVTNLCRLFFIQPWVRDLAKRYAARTTAGPSQFSAQNAALSRSSSRLHHRLPRCSWPQPEVLGYSKINYSWQRERM